MEKQTIVHIISHTHWDREWYLNSPYTREWLPVFFNSLFNMLEKEPGYRFILDGQTLMIEDYLEELESKGKDKKEYVKKLKKYVSENRLLAGPYYQQPDWQLVSGESLIRNLLIGCKTANNLGGCMKTGWLLDNFGQISQTVQIHKGFGLAGLFVWRGVDMDLSDISSEFIWESPDSSALIAIYLIDSYRNAMRLSEYPDIMEDRIIKEVEKIKPFASTSNILLMNGYDQEIVPDNILPYIRAISKKGFDVKQSTPEELITAVKDSKPRLKKLKGYLYSGRFISVFSGTLSSRMYLKIMNDRCQKLIEKYAEPISFLSWILGGEYKKDKMDALWKLLLKNHPHDNICGVSIDDVHTDMEERFEKTDHLAKNLIKDELGKLAAIIDTSNGKDIRESYIVFNTSLEERESVITIKPEAENFFAIDGDGSALSCQKGTGGVLHIHVKDIPPFGYKTVYLVSSDKKQKSSIYRIDIDEKGKIAENRFFKIKVNDDGSLDVFDKVNKVEYQGLGVFEDGADAGDTYNYSPAPYDDIFLSSNRKARKIKIDFIEKGPIKCTIKVKIEMDLPEELSEDRKTRSRKRKILPIITFITVEVNSPFVRFRTFLKNTVRDHRLRVLFPTDLNTDKSYAETQFDVVEHDMFPVPYDDKIPQKVKRVLVGAREPELITTFPQSSFVDISDKRRGVAVINKGLPEYEVIGNKNTIALTLFRSVGWLARNDLLSRTGDAGPSIYTPEAQCLREMEFDYAVYFHKGNWPEGRVHQHADVFNSDCIVVKTDVHPGVLPSKKGFLELNSSEDALKITAIKRSEDKAEDDKKGLIVRCYNPINKKIVGVLSSTFMINSAFYTDLNETVKGKIKDFNENQITFQARPKEIVTIKILLQKDGLISNSAASTNLIWPEQNRVSVDFSKYDSMPVITPVDIAKEEQRANQIAIKLENMLELEKNTEKELNESEKVCKEKIEEKLQPIKGDIATCIRTHLEAKLSLIFSKKKFNHLNPESKLYPLTNKEIDSTCREIGYKLNEARIKKRTYDYLVEYYNQKGIA